GDRIRCRTDGNRLEQRPGERVDVRDGLVADVRNPDTPRARGDGARHAPDRNLSEPVVVPRLDYTERVRRDLNRRRAAEHEGEGDGNPGSSSRKAYAELQPSTTGDVERLERREVALETRRVDLIDPDAPVDVL